MPWRGFAVGAVSGAAALGADRLLAGSITNTWAKYGIDLAAAGVFGLIAAMVLHRGK